jgi:AraC-like DNA-binding protein
MKHTASSNAPGDDHPVDCPHSFSMTSMQHVYNGTANNFSLPDPQEQLHIVCIARGGGQILTDGGLTPLNANTVYCLSSRQMMLLSPSSGTTGYLLSFTVDFLLLPQQQVNPLYSNNLFNKPAVPLDEETQTDLLRILTAMDNEYNGVSPLKTEILREYLKVVLMYLCRLDQDHREAYQHMSGANIINRFFELLGQHYTSRKKVSDYATLMSISANYLNYIIKKYSGHTVSYHIQQSLITEAKRQALHTNKSMKEIAYDLGFDENTHFSKFFKKLEGCTFSSFRKQRPATTV